MRNWWCVGQHFTPQNRSWWKIVGNRLSVYMADFSPILLRWFPRRLFSLLRKLDEKSMHNGPCEGHANTKGRTLSLCCLVPNGYIVWSSRRKWMHFRCLSLLSWLTSACTLWDFWARLYSPGYHSSKLLTNPDSLTKYLKPVSRSCTQSVWWWPFPSMRGLWGKVFRRIPPNLHCVVVVVCLFVLFCYFLFVCCCCC